MRSEKRPVNGNHQNITPLLLTSLDASGENLHEGFLGIDEQSVNLGLESLLGVP